MRDCGSWAALHAGGAFPWLDDRTCPGTEDPMAKQGKRISPLLSRSVSGERAERLYRLLQLLGSGPQTRASMIRRLRLDVRGFYRDLELLRAAGIAVALRDRRYTLEETVAAAASRLPLPDPRLTLGEALQLSKGRTPAHRKLKQQIAVIVRSQPPRGKPSSRGRP
jgi:hypothetical protein